MQHVTQTLKMELMDMFKHHSVEVEAIEQLLRQQIQVLSDFTNSREQMSLCHFSLQGKSTELSVLIEECDSPCTLSHHCRGNLEHDLSTNIPTNALIIFCLRRYQS